MKPIDIIIIVFIAFIGFGLIYNKINKIKKAKEKGISSSCCSCRYSNQCSKSKSKQKCQN